MSDKKNNGETKVVRISKKAHTKAKVKAVKEGKTISKVVEDAIEKNTST